MATERDDGVNETGLDYRAGYIEALKALQVRLNVEGLRTARKNIPGMDEAMKLSREMIAGMVVKMKSR